MYKKKKLKVVYGMNKIGTMLRAQQENMIIDVFQEVRVAHHSAVVFVSSLNATVAPKKIKEVIVTHKTGKERKANIDTFLI